MIRNGSRNTEGGSRYKTRYGRFGRVTDGVTGSGIGLPQGVKGVGNRGTSKLVTQLPRGFEGVEGRVSAAAWVWLRGCGCVGVAAWVWLRGCGCVGVAAWLPNGGECR